jgi:hypothetical protein
MQEIARNHLFLKLKYNSVLIIVLSANRLIKRVDFNYRFVCHTTNKNFHVCFNGVKK